jgi:putative oxidoreductase
MEGSDFLGIPVSEGERSRYHSMMNSLLSLSFLARYADGALLLLRLVIGSFLVWGVWDNIASTAQMDEFVAFLRQFGFPAPELMARLSVWAQFLVGVAFILGLATRWAGLICSINFIVAIVVVDRFAGLRSAFPALCLVLIGLYLATHGAGKLSVDAWIGRQR